MLTWILIAIVIAALFGIIDLNKIRLQLIEKSKEYLPKIKEYFNKKLPK